MKTLIIIISISLVFKTSQAQIGPPNQPNSICYDYDMAGNRLSQTPEWISLNPQVPSILCTPNSPENYYKPRKVFLVDFRNGPYYADFRDYLVSVSIKVKKNPIYALSREIPQLESEGAQIVKIDHPILNTINENDEIYFTIDENKNTGAVKEDLELTIVPNPTLGKFKIEQKGFDTDWTNITIVDASGRVLFVRDFINGEVNVGEFAPGVYILMLKDRTHQRIVRFEKRM